MVVVVVHEQLLLFVDLQSSTTPTQHRSILNYRELHRVTPTVHEILTIRFTRSDIMSFGLPTFPIPIPWYKTSYNAFVSYRNDETFRLF